MIDNLSTELQRRWKGYVQRYDRLYNDFFEQQFGEAYEGHQLFAYHAVFPGIVTPDLLYQIWFNFRVYPSRATLQNGTSEEGARIFAFPNFSVSDFLQSSLCQEVGFQQYAIDHELRVALLHELRQDPRFGEARIQQLAALLEQYRRQHYKKEDLLGLGDYHRWVARASLNPQSMAKELGLRLADLVSKASQDRSQLIEIRKMKRLLQDLSKTDKAFQDLADYSEVMDDYLVGNKVPQGREMVLSSVPQGAGAVAVPIFRELKEAVEGGKQEFVRKPFEPGKNKVYALIVGINEYRHTEIPDLQGPVKDALAMEAYLREQFDEETLLVSSLLDEQATRKRIINGFLHHLATAGPGDIALFFFAGQGTQENAAEVFWDVEPDQKLETLIPHDGHGPKAVESGEAYHLAQREINALIWLLDKRKPHIAMIVDACHSGRDHEEFLPEEPITFETEEGPEIAQQQQRMTEQMEMPEEEQNINLDDEFFQNRELIFEYLEPRKSEDFLFCQLEEFGDSFRSLFETEGRIAAFPEGSHVFFASGMSHEQAFEARVAGEFRGVFSYELLEELQQLSAPISNTELMDRVRKRVQERFKEQTPQLYVEGEVSLQDAFLFGALEFEEEEIRSQLLYQIGEALAEGNEQIQTILARKAIDEPELMDAIFRSFPYPITELLKQLLISRRDQIPRLIQASQLARILMEYATFVILTELANHCLRSPSPQLPESTIAILQEFFRPAGNSFMDRGLGLPMIREVLGVLQSREHTFLGNAWIGVERTLDEYWVSAYEFFFVGEEETILVDNELIDERLIVFLRPLVFLAQYQMMSMKEVELRQSPISEAPRFSTTYVDVMEEKGKVMDTLSDYDKSPDSQSVLLGTWEEEREVQILNLTPLVFDQAVLDGTEGSKLFFFSHRESESGAYLYRDVMNRDEVLEVSPSSYPFIAELMERLQEVMFAEPQEEEQQAF